MNTKASSPPNKWLVAYNSISASLWSIVFFNTVFLSLALGQPHVFVKTNIINTAIQTLAVVEIVNAVTGLVKSPVFTTATQVFSRLLLVWGIHQYLPDSPANSHWCYTTLCLSWSITEIIRYSYYAQNLKGQVPHWLTWLRYTTFYVLYPAGVFSEVYQIILSLETAGYYYGWFLKLVLVTYIPGFYMLYTYMIRQRRKVLGPKTKKAKPI
ncbi:uncharacterized protein LODBEIA_P61370 [Lodderomyces beijingensis]|uniref:Very-long-chain (3R)-3-hydroxyacyl-CoA dehydratase n=1 Tax=Lodderomyces beijingensis TaxID=1775926 RepID=A0ABP0ZVL5_9ASCO